MGVECGMWSGMWSVECGMRSGSPHSTLRHGFTLHPESPLTAESLFGNLAQLFARSPEVVAFLQCDLAPVDAKAIDSCSFLGKH